MHEHSKLLWVKVISREAFEAPRTSQSKLVRRAADYLKLGANAAALQLQNTSTRDFKAALGTFFHRRPLA